MNGKKFVVYFLLAIAMTSVAISVWIKQGYDSRPDVKIENPVK